MHSSQAIVDVLRMTAEQEGSTPLQLVSTSDREAVGHSRMDGQIDVTIPRGGED